MDQLQRKKVSAKEAEKALDTLYELLDPASAPFSVYDTVLCFIRQNLSYTESETEWQKDAMSELI